jgi:N6-adenosine-specific RNA methylase IME4
MNVRIDAIRIEGRTRKDLGDLTALADSIAEVGLLHPPVVTTDLLLVAGERRLEALKSLGLTECEVTVAHNLQEAMGLLRAEADENTCRKALTPEEMVRQTARLWELEAGEAEERKAEHGGTAPGKVANTGGNFPAVKGETRDRVASAVGTSGKTLEKARAVVQAAEAEPEKFAPLVEQMNKTGKVDGAYNKLRRAKAEENPVALPEGVFSVVYADPPWEYANSGLAGGAADHYATMPTEALCALSMLERIAPDAALFLWSTNPLLEDALRVMASWGFSYKTNFAWDKGRECYGKLGFYNYGQHELLLVGVRGSFLPAEGSLVASVLKVGKREHSRKPDEVYEIIERMYPHGAKVELFARQQRDGWCAWGNEVGTWTK